MRCLLLLSREQKMWCKIRIAACINPILPKFLHLQMALENQQQRNKQAQPNATDQLTLKDRLSSLNNLPRFFGLVWQTSKGLTIADCALRIVRSATPVAILYVGKLIIDEVIRISHAHGT